MAIRSQTPLLSAQQQVLLAERCLFWLPWEPAIRSAHRRFSPSKPGDDAFTLPLIPPSLLIRITQFSVHTLARISSPLVSLLAASDAPIDRTRNGNTTQAALQTALSEAAEMAHSGFSTSALRGIMLKVDLKFTNLKLS
jgi:hypothetical protein